MNTTELELAPVQPDEPPMRQLAPFDQFRAQAEKLKVTAETLTVTDINDKAGTKLARATRLELREVRIAIDKRRKELGEHHLRETQRINADAKVLREMIEPLEARLQDQEDFIERETARIQDEKRTTRAAELAPFLSGPVSVDLGVMTDEAYAGLLSDSKGLHAAKLEREAKEKAEAAAAKEEAERISAEKKAAAAPDKEKLLQLAATFRNVQFPEVSTDAADSVLAELNMKVSALAEWITKKANALGGELL